MRRGGSGKEVDNGAGSSLGSTSGEEVSLRGESSEAQCLAMLARSGLSMLAGKGTRLRPFTQPSSLGLRFVKGEENGGAASACSLPGGGSSGGVGKMELRPPLSGDVVRRLSMDECWRMILELGTRWPAWNGPQALQATLGVKKEYDDSTFAVADSDHYLQGGQSNTQQREQEFVKLLAARALKALAAPSPPWSAPRAGMLAPQQTQEQTQERFHRNLAAGDAPRIPTLPTLPVYQQRTPSAKAPTLSRNMSAPRSTLTRPQTAELTIFYDGVVNVCNNVPADKARLIMMYAEKAGLSAQAGALMQRSQFVPPSSGASPQGTRASPAGRSQRGLQPDSKPNKVPSPAAPSSSTPCGLARSVSQVGTSTSEPANENVVSANRAAHGKSPLPAKVTVIAQPANPPRQLRQNVMLKPLPNARRNSLARFLDSRKRWAGASSEETSPKKAAIGEGGPSDDAAEELQGNEKLESAVPSNVAADRASSDPC